MPDPRQGVFETLLVIDGRPVELDAHIVRLEASIDALYPDRSAPELGERVREHALGVTLGRMQVKAAAGRSREIETRIAVNGLNPDLPSPVVDFLRPPTRKKSTAGIALHSLGLAGGLGEHKWADRALLDRAQADLLPEDLPLIVDLDGTALEAARANLFVVRDGALFTPPLDGRILPGITRARVLELAVVAGLDANEGPLLRQDLLAADEIFLTGSVRGIEPAISLDGAALAGGGPVASELGTALRHAWLGAPVA